MSDPIVSFDEAAMRGELRELVRGNVQSLAHFDSSIV